MCPALRRLTAYKIVSANSVPDVPHLTLLDKYVVACTIFSAMVVRRHDIIFGTISHAFQNSMPPFRTDVLCFGPMLVGC